MSSLVVLTFDDTLQAGQAYDALQKAQHDGFLRIDDAAVIGKDETGVVDVKNQADTGVKWGAVGGGMLGLLLGGVFFPLAGLALGVIGGALVGKSLDMGLDQKFVRDVSEALKPGSSALFIIGKADNQDAVIARLRPFRGTIYQASLDTEKVEALYDALKSND